MPQYINEPTLRRAIAELSGSAGPMFPIWLVLKNMGFGLEKPIVLDTQNSNPSLERLFGCGDPEGRFFFPIAGATRFLWRNSQASRAVVQTNIKQFMDRSGKVHPSFLDIRQRENDQKLIISAQRGYPNGLGTGTDGFASAEGKRVSMPLLAWAIWYGRQSEIPDDAIPAEWLIKDMRRCLNLTPAEETCVFVRGGNDVVETQAMPLPAATIHQICSQSADQSDLWRSIEVSDSLKSNRQRVSLTQTMSTGPTWLNRPPEEQIAALLEEGHRAILLTGPPRTGKSRAVRQIIGTTKTEVIQIHDGWTYDHLVIGQELDNGSYTWKEGPLLKALREGVKFIVLEEANRTRLSQALGEIFSLIELAYRGENNSLTLPDGSNISVPEDTTFFFTMNNIDKSTEDFDDALFGRLRAVEFPPRVEALTAMLESSGMSQSDPLGLGLLTFFQRTQEHYPLGHGYFADLTKETDPVLFYTTAIRPLLSNHFSAFQPATLDAVDTLFDECVVQLMRQ